MKTLSSIFAGFSLAVSGCESGALAFGREVIQATHKNKSNGSVYVYRHELAKRVSARIDGKLKMRLPWEVQAVWPQFTVTKDKQLLAWLTNVASGRPIGPRYRALKEILLGRDGFVSFAI